MARNGSGTYSLPNDDLVNGETSDVTDYNSTMDDIATALSDSLTADGQKVWSGAQDANGNEIILDADGDTSITADTDDQIDFKIGGSDAHVMTANGFSKFGGQIAFPATQNASAGANTLDDYEEGTWTPDLSDGTNSDATQTTENGIYVKIGKVVFFSFDLLISSLGSVSGGLQINGLPFTANATLSSQAYAGLGAGMAITAGHVVSGQILANGTSIQLTLWDVTTGTTQLQSSELSSDGQIKLSGFYFV